MKITQSRFALFVTAFILAACAAPEPTLEPGVMSEPVIMEERHKSDKQDCASASQAVDDGIGGTGCEID